MSKQDKEHEYVAEDDFAELAQDKLKKIKAKLKRAEEERKEYLDGWQRERADFANYKRNIQQNLDASRTAIEEDVLMQVLPILDNIELALQHAPQEIRTTEYHKGIGHIGQQIRTLLSQFEIKEMEVKEGDIFDPEFHEAVAGSGDTISEVTQKGFMIRGRVLRAAKVNVKK